MDIIGQLERFCTELQCEALFGAPMSDHTTFRIGGPADVIALPDTEEKLQALIRLAVEREIKYTVVGKGSNLLVSDSGIRGLVILTARLNNVALAGEDTVVCAAGTPLIRLCGFALENSLSGLEFAYGIPGSAGGAAYMNAGAYGGEMKDVLLSCKHIDKNGVVGELRGEELVLSYRHSAYCDNGFTISGLTLRLAKADKAEIREKMNDLLSRRKAKQPLDFPSAGSTFKRPQGHFAGALIEESGLKGCSIGGAQVSEKHAGFVINKGGATAQEVLSLVEHIKKTVLSRTGVVLEPEIKIIE